MLRRRTKANDVPASRAERVKNGLWIAADVAVVGAVMGGLWWHRMNAVPTVDIPTPTMPAVNGFDVLNRASAGVTDADVINWAGAKGDRLPESRKGQPISEVEKDAALADNQEPLTLMRQSLTMPYRNPPIRSAETRLPQLAQFRQLARLLELEGTQREAHGDHAGAVASRLDAMEMGADQIPRGGLLIHYLVGVACEAIGRRPLWALADTLNADEARAATQRLQRITADQVPLADVMTEEKWMAQASLLKMFQKKNLFQVTDDLAKTMPVGGDTEGQNSPNWIETLPLRVQMLRQSKANILRDHVTVMDALIARARQPYTAKVPPPAVPADPINAILVPINEQVRLKAADVQAQNALLTVVFALRAYQVEHHDYPASLATLVTDGYLKDIPVDPLDAAGGPVRYRRLTSEKYLLYSVGLDGKDDGGAPIDNRDSEGRQKRYLELDSKTAASGDYVVGVNLY